MAGKRAVRGCRRVVGTRDRGVAQKGERWLGAVCLTLGDRVERDRRSRSRDGQVAVCVRSRWMRAVRREAGSLWWGGLAGI